MKDTTREYAAKLAGIMEMLLYGYIKDHPYEGICYLFDLSCNEARNTYPEFDKHEWDIFIYFGKVLKSWPKHSGDVSYPIRTQTLDGRDAYYQLSNHWDNTTKYGQLRYELLNHVLNALRR